MKKIHVLHKLLKLSLVNYIYIILLLIAFGYTYFFFTTKTSDVYIDMTPANEWSVDETPSGYQEANAINTGDAAYDSFGNKFATVSDIKTINYGGTKKYLRIIIKLKARYNPRMHIYSYNDTPLLIGNQLSLSLGKVSFKGKIINIYKNEEEKYANYQMKNVFVTVLFRKVEPTQTEAMKTFEAKDSKGGTIAKTIDSTVAPEEVDVKTDKGIIAHGFSTIYKDVTLKLFLPNVPCSKDTCYFNDSIDLKIGVKYFWIHSNTALLSDGIITSIEYENTPAAP